MNSNTRTYGRQSWQAQAQEEAAVVVLPAGLLVAALGKLRGPAKGAREVMTPGPTPLSSGQTDGGLKVSSKP